MRSDKEKVNEILTLIVVALYIPPEPEDDNVTYFFPSEKTGFLSFIIMI